MNNLSDATAKGSKNTAGCPLAVFFLCCLCFLTACPLNASDSNLTSYPCVKDGKLYTFTQDAGDISEPILCKLDGVTQKAVSVSKKKGWVLAWQQKSQELCHIDAKQKIRSRVKVSSYLSYVNKKFILVQTNTFDDNKGFGFKLYKINYSWRDSKISVKELWSGNADCFVSDCFFTDDGVCIAGGTQDDSKHNVFYIKESSIHKCFSVEKNSDFLRLVSVNQGEGTAGSMVYAFLSGRDKSKAQPVIYKFNLAGSAQGSDSSSQINLSNDSAFPSGFDCFFGYGFSMSTGKNQLVLPASVNGIINFLCYDYTNGKITRVVPDAGGCLASVADTENGVYYLARDPLIENSWYGLSLFTGTECKKVTAF